MYLNCHSYYSLRYGTLPVEELVAGAVKHKIPLMALTDINATTGIFDFVKLCRKGGIQAIAGVEFRDGNRHLYTAIAKNNEGFREINELLSNHNIHDHPLENPQFSNAFTIYPYGAKPCSKLTDNEFTGIRPGELNRAFREDRSKMVILAPVTFADKTGYLLHSHLRAIGNNILFSRLEPGMLAYPGEVMLPPGELLKIYEHFPRIIQNTEKLAASCSFEFDFRSHKNKHTFTGNIYEDKLLLEKLAYEGFTQRYGQNNKNAAMRLLKELEIIDKLGFSAYFLIAWDIVRFSMSQGFYHVGRGSGANSVVAYCLKITDVDPIELNLYFERFLNPKRTSPPDFDIDFSWKDRDAVQNYIFKKHSTAHTALLGTIPVFKSNSIIRELSKVYGIPKEETDRFLDNPKDELNSNRLFSRIIKLAGLIHGFPNIRSIHAGGILISDLPITCFSALDLPPKGLPTVQFDMYVAEDIGFEKFDILSQRGIGHIRECTEIVIENRGEAVDIHQVEKFKQDPKVKSQLKNGETNGCFYVESPAMRGLLKKLKCDDYLSLVAASSIIRPGVARSGMMREYIQRFNNPGSFSYIHPVMEEQLSETYGVMVYQEDVLKICHHFAGLDLADADVLRRAMSGKYRSKAEFQRIADKFFSNCRDKGYSNKLTSEVWRQIESFAGYSFSKAHSASYAVESFQSLYLKAHYPMEFMTAVINNF
ncbi:MAG: PHP domain-containing protein, partial [Bacteroidota bacterium]